MSSSRNTIIGWALTLAIVVVLNLFFSYAIMLVYEEPTYEKFCSEKQVRVVPQTQTECTTSGGQWVDGEYGGKYGYPVPASPDGKFVSYCNENYTCSNNYDSARALYNRNVFVALVLLGLVSFLVGFYVKQSFSVTMGLILGGVLSFIIGSIRYWSDMQPYLQVIILGLALVALIWFGIWKLNDVKES